MAAGNSCKFMYTHTNSLSGVTKLKHWTGRTTIPFLIKVLKVSRLDKLPVFPRSSEAIVEGMFVVMGSIHCGNLVINSLHSKQVSNDFQW